MELFGRTNIPVPPVWLSLREPESPSPGWAEALCEAAVSAKTIIDISQRPGLFGGLIAGKGSMVMAVGGGDCSRAPDAGWAKNFIEAKLVSVLSCLRQDHLDFFFLDYNGPWEEWQIDGALEAMESARQDGLIRFSGLSSSGNDLATAAMWNFHDAFDAVLMQRETYFSEVSKIGAERRCGMVTYDDEIDGWPVLKRVSELACA
ncbi:MAG: hypothetical protein JNK63_01465 [Chthonomonas sp.]|nr:hypothetical protein [Chthonomonas sp.]